MDTLELQEKNKSAASIALLALQRYFLYSRKVFHPSSVRLFCFLHTLQCLQLLSLLIPSDPHKGLPWNYSLCSWLWTSVALCTRPDEAMLSVGLSSSTVSMVYSLCIGGKAVLALAVAVGLAALKEESFDGLQGNSEQKVWMRTAIAVDYYWGVLVLRAISLPVPVFLLQHYFEPSSLAVCLLFACLKALDTAYSCSTSWFSGDFEAVSSPFISVQIWLFDLAFILLISVLDPGLYPGKFAAVLVALGAYKLVILLRTAPYHSLNRTVLELGKGLLVAWAGACLLLGVYMDTSQSSILTISLLILPFPLLVAILRHVLIVRIRAMCRVKYPQRLYEVEQILRKQVFKGSENSKIVDRAFTKASQLFPKSEQLVIWALYYYKSLKDVTFVQVNISKLMKTKWSLISYIECLACYKSVTDWLRSLPDQAEPISFWEYQVRLEEVLKRDKEITKAHCELFSELAVEQPKPERVVTLSRNLVRKISEYESFVKRTMHRHPICPELLTIYSDFLSVLTNSKRAQKYEQLAARVTAQLKANKTESSVDLYDSKCMIVVMSLEPGNIGSILWAKNCDLLGYSSGDVIGSDHCLVVPVPLKNTHTGMLKRITMFRHHHPVYESRHHLYFSHKNGSLIGAHWKVRLINMPTTGDMTIVAALKPRADAAAVAFLDTAGERVTAMVRNRQTQGFREQMKEVLGPDCPDSFDLAQAFGPGNGLWEDGKVYFKGKRANGAWLMKGEVFPIFGIYPQKVLKAYQDYSTSLRTSLRPICEGGEEVIQAVSPLSRKDASKATSSTRLFSTLPRTRGQSLISSVFESRMSASLQHDQKDTPEEPWTVVSQRVKSQRESLNRIPKWLDLAVLATLVLTLAVLLGLYVTTEQAKQATLDRVLDLHRRRELAVQASIYTLQLFKADLFPTTSEQLSTLISGFKAQIQALQEAADSDPAYRAANYDLKGLWWEYTADAFQPYMLNAMDTLRALASHTEQAQGYLEQRNNASARSVVRNGVAESVRTLNATMWAFMESLVAAEEGNSGVLPGLLALSIAAISALFVAASYLVLQRTDAARKDLWQILAHLPVSLYAAARASSKQRLEVLHFTDFLELDLNEFSFKPRKSASLPYVRLSEWKWLLAGLLLLLTGVITGLVVIYSESRKDSVYFSAQVPKLVFYSGLRKIALLEAQFFTRELLYDATAIEWWPQYYSNLEEELEKAGSRAKFYDWNLIYPKNKLEIGEVALSTAEVSVLLDRVEGNSLLKHGSHPGLNIFLSDLHSFPSLLTSASSLESHFSALLAAFESLLEANLQQAKALGESQYLHYLSLLLVMAVSLLGYYLVLVKPLVLVLISRIEEEWRLLLFLPYEAGVQVHRLLRK